MNTKLKPQMKIKIAIGTLNKAKIQAVKEIITEIWKEAEFIPAETESKVSNQPMSDTEGIKGAINRAKQALEKTSADYGIGLEGSVEENEYGMFLGGWVAIVGKNGKTGIGSSGKVLLPKQIREKIKAGEELGPIMQELVNDKDNEVRQTIGTNGILTKKLYDRTKEFKDATRCALAKFVSPEFYD